MVSRLSENEERLIERNKEFVEQLIADNKRLARENKELKAELRATRRAHKKTGCATCSTKSGKYVLRGKEQVRSPYTNE